MTLSVRESFARLRLKCSPHACRVSFKQRDLSCVTSARQQGTITYGFVVPHHKQHKEYITGTRQSRTDRSIGFMIKHNVWDSSETRLVASFVALKKTCLSNLCLSPVPSMLFSLSLFTLHHTCYVQPPYRGNNRFEKADIQNDDLSYRSDNQPRTHLYLHFRDLFFQGIQESGKCLRQTHSTRFLLSHTYCWQLFPLYKNMMFN